jgi:enediyne polyketide synthase
MSSGKRIAVVGIACRYPDADSPDRLWETVLAGRRAFRRLPDERMRQEDYYSPDPTAPDRFYTQKAAVIEGFEFDRVKHRIAGSTFRSTDMTHWLALDTVDKALADAGFAEGDGLPKTSTGVVIGNSLTGEFSRANLMRLRWPYVRRTVGAALREQGWDDASLSAFLGALEERYKRPFPPIDEDTLAGGLANTIAGRVCNHFDFKGGGYTVDGACSSSLLSVYTACEALANGKLDAAVAGGVDLSIDPFEVIGFAKTGALATGEMRVYDRGSNGFWPGEGCGMLVLMRDEDAVAEGRFRYATIAGWGYSSDGKGGITRPEADGHRLALKRAYKAAGFGIDTVGYLEGHGTGTAVGDATELRAFSAERREASPDGPPAYISTVKGNFGHTKAAAGVAGLIKAILAVRHQVIPPATSHVDPHPELTGDRPALRVPDTAQLWPAGGPIRAGVSSMGFGGINAHIVLEQADGMRKTSLGSTTRQLVRSRQDAELLLVDAVGLAELRGRVAQLAGFCAKLSFAELGDLAATLQGELADRPIRAAVVASAPQDAERRFGKLLTLLDGGARSVLDPSDGIFLGSVGLAPRIGFLFPGQGAGRRGDGGAIRRRFESVDELYRARGLPEDGDLVATAVAQPRIVTSSAAGLRVLSALGIEAVGAVGHSLGELTTLHWAGAMDEDTALDVAAARGQMMAEASAGDGTMAGLAAGPDAVRPLLDGEPVVIAGYNSPQQTVISGPVDAVERVCARAAANGLGATRISVSHAFHSAAVAPAAEALGAYLGSLREEGRFTPVERRMMSTVTGGALPADEDVAGLLTRQVLDPVRFHEAAGTLAAEVDLLLEVGPGRILKGLVAEIAPSVPAISLETDSPSLAGLLHAVAAAYTLGAPVNHEALYEGRFTRPLPLDKEFLFFASPCESAPEGDFSVESMQIGAASGLTNTGLAGTGLAGAGFTGFTGVAAAGAGSGSGQHFAGQAQDANTSGGDLADAAVDSLQLLRRLAAERAELPLEAVRADSNPLDELHLSSITVGQIVNEASRSLGITAPMATSNFATSTLAELAAMLDELADTSRGQSEQPRRDALGVAPWVRAFSVELVPTEVGPPAARSAAGGDWQLFAPDRHPLGTALHYALRRAGLGDGVVLCLPRDCDEEHVGLMLAAARGALSLGGTPRFVVVGDRRGASGLAKTLHLEAPNVSVTVVLLPLPEQSEPDQAPSKQVTDTVARIVADVAATSGFSEVHYDAAGTRRVPVLRALPQQQPIEAAGESPLSSADVLLVTGGGKGITAECALALGRDTGAAVALLGRSEPGSDPELAANLDRMAAAGLSFRYVQADVTSPDQVKAAVNQIRAELGPVTAVLHGAGRNEPHALANLDEASFRRTLAPKIGGLEAVLAATDPGTLRLLVTFGSIIGRAGLRGEGDYATANDWMTDLTYRIQEDYPACRCLALEWSVWSGAGMGERLGVLESLIREGIDPIPPGEGVALLGRLLADPRTPTSVVVMGRAEGLPTITLEERELPLLRFVDRTQVHYPGIELVVDAELSAEGDLYLADHLLDGDLLFPAVLGMEAMTQVSSALTGRTDPPALEDVEFLRPIVVPVGGSTTVRIATLVEADGVVQAVIRSGETGFQADHFRATLRYPGSAPAEGEPLTGAEAKPWLPVKPAEDLYGSVLFQGRRFQRLLGYRHLAAKSCVAQISTSSPDPWFAGFMPSALALGDPGSRDTFMHAIQCCVPDATLLPAGIERLCVVDPDAARSADQVALYATERSHEGDTYVYDLDIRDPEGRVVEYWRGLRLQAVRKVDGAGPWVPALLGPFLERRSEAMVSTALRCVVWPDGEEPATGRAARRRQTNEAVNWAVGRNAVVRYRPDGRPEISGNADGDGESRIEISSAHGGGVTFVLAHDRPVACDVEVAATRSEQEWADLLGADGFALARLLSTERGEDLSLAGTRVWGAIECLRKSGRARVDPITAAEPRSDRWVRLRAGSARIATFPTRLRGVGDEVVFTMMTESGD